MNINNWSLLGQYKGNVVATIPANAIHVRATINETKTSDRSVWFDLYPNIDASGTYTEGAYYFNGAGLGSQIQWDKTARTLVYVAYFIDGSSVISDANRTIMTVYYRT